MDYHVALGGLIVGILVGLSGVGGGSLMLPVLVLLFNVSPRSRWSCHSLLLSPDLATKKVSGFKMLTSGAKLSVGC